MARYFYLFKFAALKKRIKRSTTQVKLISFFSKKNYNFKFTWSRLELYFGTAGFVNQSPLILSSSFFIKFLLILKRIVRKRGKSLRYYYFKPKNLLKVSKQSKGARMGKGKGKSLLLVQRFVPNASFVEFAGVRTGRLRFFLNFFSTRFASTFFLFFGRSVLDQCWTLDSPLSVHSNCTIQHQWRC